MTFVLCILSNCFWYLVAYFGKCIYINTITGTEHNFVVIWYCYLIRKYQNLYWLNIHRIIQNNFYILIFKHYKPDHYHFLDQSLQYTLSYKLYCPSPYKSKDETSQLSILVFAFWTSRIVFHDQRTQKPYKLGKMW